MRSDCKIPEVWTIVNNRQYIWWLESRYSGWHKRNYITVKCLECWLERHIEAKWFRDYWCKCNQLASIKTKHWFQSKENPELHRFYNIYCWIKARCKWTAWKDAKKRYYDKWIKCLWNSFEEFKNDMYDDYIQHVRQYWEKNTSIDRIDNSGDYCRENCRRATNDIQNYNKWTNVHVEIDWEIYNSLKLSERCWICRSTACKRLRSYIDWKITKEKLFAKKSRK